MTSDRRILVKGFKVRIRALLATFALLVSLGGAVSVVTPSAQASPWDPHVRVWFNVNSCAGAYGQWGWYRSDDGEQGWVRWNAGYQGYFDLWSVSTSGNVTRISWGTPGRTCGVRYFNITRPWYGTTAALGWIG
jgi:hypothetical protein